MKSNTETFLDYYCKYEVCLSESPMRLGRSYGQDLDNAAFNVENAIEAAKLPEVDIQPVQSLAGTDLHLHREHYNDDRYMDYWLTDQPFITCYWIFQPVDQGVQTLGVWNHQQHAGTARQLLFEYYLKKFAFVVSDNKHTTQGELFWKKIIDEADKRRCRLSVLTRTNQEYAIDDAEAYWGNTHEFADYRIKIYSQGTPL